MAGICSIIKKVKVIINTKLCINIRNSLNGCASGPSGKNALFKLCVITRTVSKFNTPLNNGTEGRAKIVFLLVNNITYYKYIT